MQYDNPYDVDVLLADGSVATIRTPGRQDARSIEALHERASDDSLFSRFFNLNRPMAIRYVAQMLPSVLASQCMVAPIAALTLENGWRQK